MSAPTAFARKFGDAQAAVEFIHDYGKALFTFPEGPREQGDSEVSDGLTANQLHDARAKARALARAFLEHTGGL